MNEEENNQSLEFEKDKEYKYWNRLPKKLREELAHPLYQVKNEDMDLLFVIDGKEGSGKSSAGWLLAAACAEFLGTPFTVDNIHYDPEAYMKASDSTKNYVQLLDEAGVTLDNASGNTNVLKRFNRYMQVARSETNNVHIIILPAFHILHKYLVNWRCRFVINMWAEKEKANVPGGYKTKRGAFCLYKSDGYLYNCWKTAHDGGWFPYPKVWRVRDRLPHTVPFTDDEVKAYNAKKSKWRNDYINGDTKETKKLKKDVVLEVALKLLEERGVSERKLAELTGTARTYISSLKRDGRTDIAI